MITIALQQDEQQRYSGFCISGHAESVDEGYDLVFRPLFSAPPRQHF